jgi:hypothetical protein
LNPRHSRWQRDALPLSYTRKRLLFDYKAAGDEFKRQTRKMRLGWRRPDGPNGGDFPMCSPPGGIYVKISQTGYCCPLPSLVKIELRD